MKNLGNIMKQVQDMQTRMTEMQERLAQQEITGSSGAGMVQATLNGKSELKRLKIDPALLKPEDAEVIEDLIVAAVNDARGKVEKNASDEMSKVTGGLPLPPGFKLPF